MMGRLFIIAGADGVGKTTQVNNLESMFPQASFISWKHSPLAELLEKVIKASDPRVALEAFISSSDSLPPYVDLRLKEALRSDKNLMNVILFSLALASTTKFTIVDLIKCGKDVFCDRGIECMLAYQGCSKSYLDKDEYIKLCYSKLCDIFSEFGVSPKISRSVIYLYIDKNERLKRLLARTDQVDSFDADMNLQLRLDASYNRILDMISGDSSFGDISVKKVNAAGSVDEVFERVKDSIKSPPQHIPLA